MANPKRVKLSDVAKAAGLSIGATSDALSGKNRIPDETRTRVREIANSLGYSPNPIARALTSGHLPLIGLVISAIDRKAEFDAYRSYWADVISAATTEATKLGYALVVLSSLKIEQIRLIPYAGLIVVDSVNDDPDLDIALNLDVAVATDYVREDERIAVHFRAEYGDSVQMAMDCLLEKGAKKLAILLPNVEEAVWVQHVEESARYWSDRTGICVECKSLPIDGSQTNSSLRALLEQGIDGIYSLMPTEDFMSSMKSELKKIGKSFAKDFNLAMLDEDRLGELRELGIATIGISATEYAQSIVASLVNYIENKAEHTHLNINFSLIKP
ncbi:MAG: hypothetical protein RLZZ330_602 [Actinomycetota bacterium]|jgi:DNA-binding LacI/PurR family transcriptional regulator